MQPRHWGLLPTSSTLYSVAFVFLSIYSETGLILLPCGLFISFSFFLKENPTNNNKVTDLKFNRSVHKLFFDRMSKNFSLHTHWTRWFQLTWFDISVTAHHERLCIVFWIVMVDLSILSAFVLPVYFLHFQIKNFFNPKKPHCKAKLNVNILKLPQNIFTCFVSFTDFCFS